MKKQTKRNTRSFQITRILTILLALVLILPVLSPMSVLAEPEDVMPAISENSEEITVYSITVNVNSETNEVFTELVLKNENDEDREITFPLPVISNGVDYLSLYVAGANKEPVEARYGVVTINVKSGDFAGLTYCYKTRRPLSYDRVIAFDLTQLSDHFCDQVGIFNWNVDMPLYEIALVRDIQPVNYQVENNRISINLTAFTVSPLLNQVSLTRVTHYDLLERVEMAQEYRGGDFTDQEIENALAFVENYRRWFQDPSTPIQEKVYLDNDFYALDGILQWTREETEYFPGNPYTVAFNAQYSKTDPVVYAVLLTSQPDLSGTKLYAQSTPEPEWLDDHWGVQHIYYSLAQEEALLRTPATYQYYGSKYHYCSKYRIVYLREEDLSDPSMVQNYLDTLHAKAVIRSQMILKGSEISEKLSVTQDGWSWYNCANYSYGGTEQYPYESFANDLADSLMTLMEESEIARGEYTLLQQEESLDEILPIPVLTLYWGYAYPAEDDLKNLTESMDPDQYMIHGAPETGSYVATPFVTNTILSAYSGIELIDKAFDHEIPKQMRGDHEAEWMEDAVRYGFEYTNALESLKLSDEASLKEAAKKTAEEKNKPEETKDEPTEPESETERETEKQTEEVTEEPTGAQTEPETEETEEKKTEAETEEKKTEAETEEAKTEAETEEAKTEPKTERTGESVTEQKTELQTEGDTEEETVKPVPSPSKGSGGIVAVLVILVLVFGVVIVGLVLILAVVILMVLSKKNHKSKEDIQQ